MLSILKYGFYASVLAGAAYVFVGPDKLLSFASQGERLIKEKLDSQTLEDQLEDVRDRIEGLDHELGRLKHDVIERRVEIDTLSMQIGNREGELSRLQRNLEKAREYLAEDRATYRLSGITYSLAEIEADAELKFQEYRTKEEALANLSQTLEIKKHALKVSNENVHRAQALRSDLDGKTRLLAAELQRFRAKEVYAESVDQGVRTEELKTELGKAQQALRDFEKKLAVEDRMLQERMKLAAGGEPGGIDYEAVAINVEDISTRIEHYFLLGNPDGVTSRVEEESEVEATAVAGK